MRLERSAGRGRWARARQQGKEGRPGVCLPGPATPARENPGPAGERQDPLSQAEAPAQPQSLGKPPVLFPAPPSSFSPLIHCSSVSFEAAGTRVAGLRLGGGTPGPDR